MSRFSTLLLLLPLCAACIFAPAQPPAQPAGDPYKSAIQWKPYNGKKMRLAIADFDNRSGYGGSQFSRTAQKMLASALTQSGHFDVFEGDAVQSVLAQQGFQNSGLVNQQSAVKIGNLIGAQFLVSATITELGESRDQTRVGGTFQSDVISYKATVDVSMVDLQTGQTILSDTQTALIQNKSTAVLGGNRKVRSDDSKLTEAIRDAIDKVAYNLVEKTPESGFDFQIANINGGKIAINAAAGEVVIGQKLRVFRRGTEIKDPATGASLGFEEDEIGMLEVLESKGKLSYCRILGGNGFTVGDVVRP